MNVRLLLPPLLVIGLVAMLASGEGCGNSNHGPTTASDVPQALPTKLIVSGNVSLTTIGETSQLTATAVWSDGSTKTVTAEVNWSSSTLLAYGGATSVVTISSGGGLTAVGFGIASIGASYRGQSDFKQVTLRPAGTFTLSGQIKEPVNVGVERATVEILDGPAAGQSTRSEYDGSYQFFAVSGNLRVRATKDGYLAVVQFVSMTADERLDFDLTPVINPVTVAGTYRLTLTASNTCRDPLPAEASSRTYIATITQDGAGLQVDLSGAELLESHHAFSGRVAPRDVSFTILWGDTWGEYGLLEHITPQTYLAIGGTAVGTVKSSTIEGTLDGPFWAVNGAPFPLVTTVIGGCDSPGHHFIFERRSSGQRR
jgi:hypothetical protein